MDYPIALEGFEGRNICVRLSKTFSKPQLLENGVPIQSVKQDKKYLLVRNDGKQIPYSWKENIMGLDAPTLVVDGKEIHFISPMKWYEFVWCELPIILTFVGGMLGGFIGIAGGYVNVLIFRSGIAHSRKLIFTGLVSLFSTVVFFIMAVIVNVLIRRYVRQ